MVREFKEETGAQTHCLNWWLGVTLLGTDFTVDFFYSLDGDQFADQVQTMTSEPVECWSAYSLPPSIIHNCRAIIALALDQSIVKPLVLYDASQVTQPLPVPVAGLVQSGTADGE